MKKKLKRFFTDEFLDARLAKTDRQKSVIAQIRTILVAGSFYLAFLFYSALGYAEIAPAIYPLAFKNRSINSISENRHLITDCEDMNGYFRINIDYVNGKKIENRNMVRPGIRCKTKSGVVYERVIAEEYKPKYYDFIQKHGNSWRDLTTGIVWLDLSQVFRPKAKGKKHERLTNYFYAVKYCRDLAGKFNVPQGHKLTLPNKEDFRIAERHGFRQVLPFMLHNWYWSSNTIGSIQRKIFQQKPKRAYAYGFGSGAGVISVIDVTLNATYIAARCIIKPCSTRDKQCR